MSEPCLHPQTELVTLISGEDVARVCTTCLARLSVEYGCTDCEWAEIGAMGFGVVALTLTGRCLNHSGRER